MDGSIMFARWRQCRPTSIQYMLYWTNIPNSISISSAVFEQLTAVPILYSGPIFFRIKIVPLHEGSVPYLSHSSFDPLKSQPKRHVDRFSGFCRTHGRDRPTDRPTDHATRSVTIGRICVRSAMRPNNAIY